MGFFSKSTVKNLDLLESIHMTYVFRYLVLEFSINRLEKLIEEQKEVKKNYTTKNTMREPSVGLVSVGSNW